MVSIILPRSNSSNSSQSAVANTAASEEGSSIRSTTGRLSFLSSASSLRSSTRSSNNFGFEIPSYADVPHSLVMAKSLSFLQQPREATGDTADTQESSMAAQQYDGGSDDDHDNNNNVDDDTSEVESVGANNNSDALAVGSTEVLDTLDTDKDTTAAATTIKPTTPSKGRSQRAFRLFPIRQRWQRKPQENPTSSH